MKKLLIFGLSLIFLSCIGIDSKMTLAADGSGTIELVYTVSAVARDWDTAETGAESPLPIPINETDIRRSVEAVPGLSLESYSRTEEADTSVINVRLRFASLDALNSFVSGSDAHFSLTQEGNRTVFEQVISPGSGGEIDERTGEFINAFFKTYTLNFSLTAPRAITRTSPSGGNSSGAQASFSVPLAAALESREAIVWRVEW
jgi:hypothetical protein